jgi:predicted aspartyl protease
MKVVMRMRKIKSTMAGLVFLVVNSGAGLSQTAKAPVEAPFEFVHNQIVLQVKINGKGPFNVLLDTNTDPSAIDATTGRELGLQVESKGAPATGGGTESNAVYPTKLSAVELGSLTAKDVLAATISLTKLSERIGRQIHGVLGYSFLKDRIVQIDYPNLKLRFYPTTPYPALQFAPNTVDKVAFPMRREDGDVIIDSVFINDQKMKATLDTGSSGGFALTPEAVKTLGLEEQALDGKSETGTGYNDDYEHKVGVLKSVRLGKIALDSAPATFWLVGTGHDNKSYQVNIGNGFFQDFVVTFDFRNKMVVFERVD